MKIRIKDVRKRNPYWKLASFKRIHKNKKVYNRKNGMIDGPAGKLPEGHPDHPWEKEAIKAETKK